MELFVYKCPLCGFAHQVPAYWMSNHAQPEFEMEHFNFKTGECCEQTVLKLKEE